MFKNLLAVVCGLSLVAACSSSDGNITKTADPETGVQCGCTAATASCPACREKTCTGNTAGEAKPSCTCAAKKPCASCMKK